MPGKKIKAARHPLVSKDNIHLFEFKGKHFVYLVYSTRSSEISERSAYIIGEALKQRSPGNGSILLDCGHYETGEVRTEYDALMNELDKLLEDEVGELEEMKIDYRLFANDIAKGDKFAGWRQTMHMNYYIYLTRGCNLACRYCWNHGGALDRKGPPFLDKKMIERTMDFIFDDSKGRKTIDVTLFGGEPLLMDIELLEHLFAYGGQLAKKRKKKIKYLIDTNGTVWNSQLESLLKRQNVILMVSLDGTKEQHDRYRIFKNGNPSHELITGNIKKMVKALPEKVGGRALLGDPDLDLVEAYNFMEKLDLAEIQINYYYFSGYAGSSKKGRTLPPSTIEKFEKNMERWVDHVLERVRSGRSVYLDSGLFEKMIKRSRGHGDLQRCFLGTNQLVIQTDGRLYPCLHMHSDDLCLGNMDEGIVRWDMLKDYATRSLFTMDKCRKCWARFSCGGCCIGRSITCQGEWDAPIPVACERTRYETKAVSYLASELKKIDPDMLNGNYI